MKKILCITLFSLSLAATSFSQISDDERRTASRDAAMKDQIESTRRSENQPPSLPKIKRFYSDKLTKEQKKRITPSDEVSARYKQFLKQSKTGIVKILLHPNCDLRIVDASDPKCIEALPILGMGARYSFNKKSHNISFADITLINNKLFVSGLIIDLGDSDINLYDLNSESIQPLKNFAPVKNFSEISDQNRQLADGIEVNGKTYSSKTLAKLNTTYAIRSITYYPIRYHRTRIYYDDTLLVFRIVDVDSDGGITLIWKELQKKTEVKTLD